MVPANDARRRQLERDDDNERHASLHVLPGWILRYKFAVLLLLALWLACTVLEMRRAASFAPAPAHADSQSWAHRPPPSTTPDQGARENTAKDEATTVAASAFRQEPAARRTGRTVTSTKDREENDDRAPEIGPAVVSRTVPSTRNATHVTVATLPIHMIDPSANHSWVLPWSALASAWDRHTTFEDLTSASRHSPLPTVPPDHRVAILMHLSPKMASTTLRTACRANYLHSCGMAPKKPLSGYTDVGKLADMVRQCNTTHHFCTHDMFTTATAAMEKIAFFHVYPFRNYEAWTVSALKQPYDVGGERRCGGLRRMMETCTDRHGELAFFKYPKTRMSEVQPQVVRRIHQLQETHHTIVYPFRKIDGLLSVMSARYRIPLLPGSDGEEKKERPKNGTCDQAILDKFHECFSDRLIALP